MITKESKWEELSVEEKDSFESLSKDKSGYLHLFKIIMDYPTCFMCSYKNPKSAASLDFHLKSTHGFTLDEIINAKLKQ